MQNFCHCDGLELFDFSVFENRKQTNNAEHCETKNTRANISYLLKTKLLRVVNFSFR